MDVFGVRDRLIDDYREFTGSFVDIHDRRIARGPGRAWPTSSRPWTGYSRPRPPERIARFGGMKGRTNALILEIYDAMANAGRTGVLYETILDPPPGQGLRHPRLPAEV